jgi:exportin-2 (importin alpha re-exporter)
MHLMFGISISAESTQHGVSQVNELGKLMEFFSSNVIPELQDSNHATRPMLKSTSIKFVSTFRNQFSKEQLIALMPMLITHLSSPVVVVHTYTAFTIEKILTTKDGNNIKFGTLELRPFLETIFTGLFRIIDNANINENEYAMKCVMRILIVANEDVLPATQAVLDKLTVSLARVAKNPRNPRYNHWLFESIAVLVKSVCKVEPSATTAFEGFLFPPFQIILQMDVSEFTPYVFQIFAQLLEFRPQGSGLGNAYTGMLQGCLSPVAWERKGNIPALTRLLKAYLQQAASDIVNSGSFMALLGVWQKLVSSKANEQNSFELLTSIVRYVPHEALQPLLTQIFAILFTRLQSGKTPRFVRLVTNFFALFVGKYGSQSFFDQLNAMQAGMGLMVMVQIWLPRLKSDPPVRLDAKMHVIALMKLSCETPALLADDNAKKLWGETVATIVFLLSSPDMGQAPDDGPIETEITSDAGYSVLINARRPVEDPFAEVADPMRSFAQALALLSTSHPGQLQPIIQQSLSVDPKLAGGLENMLRNAGVSLI